MEKELNEGLNEKAGEGGQGDNYGREHNSQKRGGNSRLSIVIKKKTEDGAKPGEREREERPRRDGGYRGERRSSGLSRDKFRSGRFSGDRGHSEREYSAGEGERRGGRSFGRDGGFSGERRDSRSFGNSEKKSFSDRGERKAYPFERREGEASEREGSYPFERSDTCGERKSYPFERRDGGAKRSFSDRYERREGRGEGRRDGFKRDGFKSGGRGEGSRGGFGKAGFQRDDFNRGRRGAGFGVKRAEAPVKEEYIFDEENALLKIGETGLLKVKEISKIGAFLDIGLPKDMLLPFREQTYCPKPDEEVLVHIYMDKTGRPAATMRVYSHLSADSEYNTDDTVEGIIYEINPKLGAFVAVDNKYFGLIPPSELYKEYRCGERVECRVISRREDGKLDLSPRKKAYQQMDEDAEAVCAELERNGGVLPYDDKSISPELIKEIYEMSKAQFKRAVGRLLRDKRIKIAGGSISLSESEGGEPSDKE